MDSCISENSEIVGEKDIQNIECVIEKHYEQFLTQSKGKVNSEPLPQGITPIRIQLQTHEQDIRLFLERKEPFENFYLHWHPQQAAKLIKIEKKLKEIHKTIKKRLGRAEIFGHQGNEPSCVSHALSQVSHITFSNKKC